MSPLKRRLVGPGCRLLVAGLLLGGCGDTLQNEPLRDRNLLGAVATDRFPVYWLGRAFDGMPVSGVSKDANGALTISYGDCTVGGQGICVNPLQVVSTPDNSFLVGDASRRSVLIRGRQAELLHGGSTVAIATGRIVVDVYAQSPALAQAAARSLMTINRPGVAGAPLPPAGPPSGYDRTVAGGPAPPYHSTPANGVQGTANVGP